MSLERRLLAWNEKRGDVEALHRAITEHPDWRVLEDKDGGTSPLIDEHGKRWLTLFSNDDALYEFKLSSGYKPEKVGRTPGYVALKTMLDDVTGVQLNPDTPTAIHFTLADHGEQLERWGNSVFVEQTLADPGMVEDPFRVYREFGGYMVVVVKAKDGTETVAMAPDDKGRKLVAVFTAPDTVRAFVDQNKSRLAGSVRVLHYTGAKLFKTLTSRQMDGIVFNCSGPIVPRAFQASFAEKVLTGV